MILSAKVGKEAITTTTDHPFWNADASEYQRAEELERGDRVLATGGQVLKVRGLRAGSKRAGTAYNLEVADIYTNQVGDAGVLVHNSCGSAANDAAEGLADDLVIAPGGPTKRIALPADPVSPQTGVAICQASPSARDGPSRKPRRECRTTRSG